jgi:hypothetical protein
VGDCESATPATPESAKDHHAAAANVRANDDRTGSTLNERSDGDSESDYDDALDQHAEGEAHHKFEPAQTPFALRLKIRLVIRPGKVGE